MAVWLSIAHSRHKKMGGEKPRILYKRNKESDNENRKESTSKNPNQAVPKEKPNEQITDKEKQNKSTPKPSTSTAREKRRSIAEIQGEQINPLDIERQKPRIISRMQIKDLKPNLQTCPLSNENRMQLKKESPFYVNMKELCTPERLFRLEAEKIPEMIPFEPYPLAELRQTFRAYGNCKLFIQPLWHHFKKSDKFFTVNFQSFARENLIVKIMITNSINFQIRPKIKELKPFQKGAFQLYYSKEKRLKTPYNLFLIAWMTPGRWRELKHLKVAFFDLAVHEGGFLIIPVSSEDYNHHVPDKKEDATDKDKTIESQSKTNMNDVSNASTTGESQTPEKLLPNPDAKRIKAVTPMDVSSCSHVTQESRKQK